MDLDCRVWTQEPPFAVKYGDGGGGSASRQGAHLDLQGRLVAHKAQEFDDSTILNSTNSASLKKKGQIF